MPEDIVAQGLELMLYGMGTVLVFLTLLVLATTLMSWVIARFFPDLAVSETSLTPASIHSDDIDDARLIAVISAAIHRHRSRGDAPQ